MLSFIIIGRNEGWKLTKCLQSVFDSITFNNLIDAEVIYIDSKSTDNSIELAKAFKKVKVFLISGVCNAAIARNIGAQEAKGDILFFIDGDMEINKEFLPFAIENNQLKYDSVTGHLDDYLYDNDDIFLCVKNRTYKNEIPITEQKLKTNGGIFLIKKKVWTEISGLRTEFRINEDNDLTLRLLKKGISTIRIPALITKHHTVDYSNDKRMWKDLSKLYHLYPGLLFRKHLFNLDAWKRTFRSNYTAFLFLLLCILLFININFFCIFLLLIFLPVFILRVIKNTNDSKVSKNKLIYFIEKLVCQFCNDLFFWVGFFFYYPKSKKMEYYAITN